MADIFGRIVAPFVKRNNWTKSQQAQHYKRLYNIFDYQQDVYGRQNIPGATDMEDVSTSSAAQFQQNVGFWNNYVYASEKDKVKKLSVCREMSLFPEISFALNEIKDEAIHFNDDGSFIELVIKNARYSQNENIVRNLNKEFNYIINDVMKAAKNAPQWFMEYMIDGEIMFEKIVDPVNAKERGILRVKRLRPEFTYPIWEEIESEEINQFVHKTRGQIMIMPPEMVAYANSGMYDYPDEDTKIVVSYLEDAKVSYRKLKQMEDALVIYRLVKAPERRVFQIDVGNLPRGKAEQVIQDMIRRYRQRQTFDPATGETSQATNTMAMIEDFFFPNFNGGRGHKIETLPGGENLGQIDDVMYFLDKLYRALRIPMSRMKADTGFSLGDTSDITREEVRFNKMVNGFVRRFSEIFVSIFMSHIRLKGYAKEYGITEKDIEIKMLSSNIFKEFIESNVFNNRAEIFERFVSLTEPGENGEMPSLSKRWLMKKFLKFSTDDLEENEIFLKEDKEKGLIGGSGGGEGGGLGDLGGGGGLGDLEGLGGGDLGDLGSGGGEDLGDLGGLEDLGTSDLEGGSKPDEGPEESFA